jgi:putative Mg2+ transporter-C (MgtC) family protein
MLLHMLISSCGHIGTAVFGRLDAVMVGRLLVTLVLCGAIGLERGTHERASGFRPHILVGLGACLLTMTGAYGFPQIQNAERDPLRLAVYVVSGIGFLGAGAILRHGTTVRGLTTAASLWNVAGVGIAVGTGLGLLAVVMVALILFTLAPLQRWEARLRLGASAGELAIHLQNDSEAVGKTLAVLSRLDVTVKRATIQPGAGESAILRVELGRALRAEQVAPLAQRLLALKYVSRVDTTDVNMSAESGPSAYPDEETVYEDARERQARDRVGSETPRVTRLLPEHEERRIRQ